MMDEQTLIGHRQLCVIEPIPSYASLSHLTSDEAAVYHGLLEHRWGDRLRLEQELVDWKWARRQL